MPKVWQEHGRHGSVFGHAACNPPLFLQRLTKSQREVISYLSLLRPLPFLLSPFYFLE
jgi:hypothetical protein